VVGYQDDGGCWFTPNATEAQLVDRLRNDGAVVLSQVAVESGNIVGHRIAFAAGQTFPGTGTAAGMTAAAI
jgi:predicted N-acetyltransferase YhbS